MASDWECFVAEWCLPNYSPTHDALVNRFLYSKTKTVRKVDLDASPGAEGWKDVLQLGKIRIGWVVCRIRERTEVAGGFMCLGYGHGSQGCCNPDRKNACWRCGATGHLARSCKATPRCLTCLDRGDKDIAHVSGGSSCPVSREELCRLRGRN